MRAVLVVAALVIGILECISFAMDGWRKEYEAAHIFYEGKTAYGKPYPGDGRPEQPIPFPDITDLNSLVMKLERHAGCLIECPAYTVEVHGNGTVIFDGRAGIAVTGKHITKIDPTDATALYQAFRDAAFFNLYDEYSPGAADAEAQTISIMYVGFKKSVMDSMGREVNMPRVVDGAAIHGEWIDDGNGTAPCDLLSAAAHIGNLHVVKTVLKHRPPQQRKRWLGNALIAAADASTWNNEHPEHAAVVATLLKAGADVNMRDESGMSAIMAANTDAEIVKILLKAGARDINTRYQDDETPLMRSFDADVSRTLLEAGANPYLESHHYGTALDMAENRQDKERADVLRAWVATHPPGKYQPAPRLK